MIEWFLRDEVGAKRCRLRHIPRSPSVTIQSIFSVMAKVAHEQNTKMKAMAGLTEGKIKTQLVRHLRETGATKGARVISELCVAGFSRRADVVLVNGMLSAFEIKGEFDNLDRLAGQLETFSLYFESLTVVCACRHTEKVLATVPSNVGVWEVTAEQISVKRPAVVTQNEERDIWLSYLPVRVLKPFLAEQRIRSNGQHRSQLLEAAREIKVSVIRQAALDYLKGRGQVPSGFKVQTIKASRVDPVRLNDIRAQEYLSLMRITGETLQAVPRRVTNPT